MRSLPGQASAFAGFRTSSLPDGRPIHDNFEAFASFAEVCVDVCDAQEGDSEDVEHEAS